MPPSCVTRWCGMGAIFQATTDTEVIVHLFARSREDSAETAIVEALAQVRGAYSLVMMTRDRLIGARDPHGFRPLAIGRLGDAWVLCSETCAMDLIGATYLRDVEPGEVVVISDQGMKSIRPFPPAPKAQCIFEHVYFSRPDSYVFGESVNEIRTEFGRKLAHESAVEADVIVPIPDSGVCAAIGYSEASGIPDAHGPDSEPLRRPHVHRAATVDSTLWCACQVESRSKHSRRTACRAG